MAKIKHGQLPIFTKSYDIDFISKLSLDECALQLKEFQRRSRRTTIQITRRGDRYPFRVSRDNNMSDLIVVGYLTRWGGTGTRVQAKIHTGKSESIAKGILGVLLIPILMVIDNGAHQALALFCYFPLVLVVLLSALPDQVEKRATRALVQQLEHYLKSRVRIHG